MRDLFAIIGPTATGKTSYALSMAAENNGELVNVDSRQIYRRLDIVTGKDINGHTFTEVRSAEGRKIGYYEMARAGRKIPVWLYDIVDPKEPFSSHDYSAIAVSVIADILSRGKTPILVGGTYYYLRHLLYGVGSSPVAPMPELREELGTLTVQRLQERLHSINPAVFSALNNSDKHNPRRLIRKIELSMESGFTVKANPDTFTVGERIGQPLKVHVIGLQHSSRERMREVIAKRVADRIRTGAIAETSALLRDGYELSDPGMKTIGYPQLYLYLQGKMTLEQAKEQWILKETQYVKRQMTFMIRDEHIKWRNIA